MDGVEGRERIFLNLKLPFSNNCQIESTDRQGKLDSPSFLLPVESEGLGRFKVLDFELEDRPKIFFKRSDIVTPTSLEAVDKKKGGKSLSSADNHLRLAAPSSGVRNVVWHSMYSDRRFHRLPLVWRDLRHGLYEDSKISRPELSVVASGRRNSG
jgi:hypothetical protein